ncbi:Calcium-dependent secretion activator [Intoshia linei]|uniref:Calcium-dependent secretion activator n=1 Tax=Intoshia linei TaxID=1819745 RepID=A0A177B8W4_9BILA|nr:Calcium-dependent secretion activator [Intoshia linei]
MIIWLILIDLVMYNKKYVTKIDIDNISKVKLKKMLQESSDEEVESVNKMAMYNEIYNQFDIKNQEFNTNSSNQTTPKSNVIETPFTEKKEIELKMTKSSFKNVSNASQFCQSTKSTTSPIFFRLDRNNISSSSSKSGEKKNLKRNTTQIINESLRLSISHMNIFENHDNILNFNDLKKSEHRKYSLFSPNQSRNSKNEKDLLPSPNNQQMDENVMISLNQMDSSDISNISVTDSNDFPKQSSHETAQNHNKTSPSQSSELFCHTFDNLFNANDSDCHIRRNLQLYVLVIRCIASPFNAKQCTNFAAKPMAINWETFNIMKNRFSEFITGQLVIDNVDVAFMTASKYHYNEFLCKPISERMINSKTFTIDDFHTIFKNHIKYYLDSLPEIEGLSKSSMKKMWLNIYFEIVKPCEDVRKSALDSDVLSKDQMYSLVQEMLKIKKYQHQIFYNLCQLDNMDEQAAQIRRELVNRMNFINQMDAEKNYPKFVIKEMELLYIEEQRLIINNLMETLESVPIIKNVSESRLSLNKLKRTKKIKLANTPKTLSRVLSSLEEKNSIRRNDAILEFKMAVIIIKISGLKSIQDNKIIYCTMELDNGQKFQTTQANISNPIFDVQADFKFSYPLPNLKIRLFLESSNILKIDDREIAKIHMDITPYTRKISEVHRMINTKHITDKIDIGLNVIVERPTELKHCGYLYVAGKKLWKKWKLRYFALTQISQYKFALCNYKPKKNQPIDIISLEGFTVYYCDSEQDDLSEFEKDSSKLYFFSVVKEGESYKFATAEQNERIMWVQAIYRATGQLDKPVISSVSNNDISNTTSKFEPKLQKKNNVLEECVQSNPIKIDHYRMFKVLLRFIYKHRFNDGTASQGYLSAAQLFIIDEYCSRYGVRGCYRHLSIIEELLGYMEEGILINPNVLNTSYSFCASHTNGHRPDNEATVFEEERNYFNIIKGKLRTSIASQITEFRERFPHNRPPNMLKDTFTLLDRVILKSFSSKESYTETCKIISQCLEEAFLNIYTTTSEKYLLVDNENFNLMLEDIYSLAEDIIIINEDIDDNYRKAFEFYKDMIQEFNEKLWALYTVDMESVLIKTPKNNWIIFDLFYLLNDFIISNENLINGKFHKCVYDLFSAPVVDYIHFVEEESQNLININLEFEKWNPTTLCCKSIDKILNILDNQFVKNLNWCDTVFNEHLIERFAQVSKSSIKMLLNKLENICTQSLKNLTIHFKATIPNCALITFNALELSRLHIDNDEKIIIVIDNLKASMLNAVIETLCLTTNKMLVKLSRYDKGTLKNSLFSIGNFDGGFEFEYIDFVRTNIEKIQILITDDIFVIKLLQMWYFRKIQILNRWLCERTGLPLSDYQSNVMSVLLEKTYHDFELYGVGKPDLDIKAYENISLRLKSEVSTIKLKRKK